MAEPALALRDHPQIIDLISVLEQNGLQKQKEEVQARSKAAAAVHLRASMG